MIHACIYAITYTLDENQFYIGSTRQSLTKRFSDHFSRSKQKDHTSYNSPFNTFLREHDNNDFKIEPLFEGEFEDDQSIKQKEDEYIKDFEPPLNKYRAHRTIEEEKEYNRLYMEEKRKDPTFKEKEVSYNKEYDALPWTCEICKFTTTNGNKSNHLKKSKEHQRRLKPLPEPTKNQIRCNVCYKNLAKDDFNRYHLPSDLHKRNLESFGEEEN